MSDLQCPATLIIASSDDAVEALNDVRSDERQPLRDAGRAQVRDLVEELRNRRVSAVYSSTMQRAVQCRELASAELGIPHSGTNGLQECGVDESGPEDGATAVKRFELAIEGIADTHRGETVLVFTHAGVMSLALPRLSVNVPNDSAAQRFLSSGTAIKVEIDADGWRIVS